MKKFIYTILFLANMHVSYAAIHFIDVDEIATWEQMVELAKAQKLNLFVQILPMPCADCKELKKTTFKNKELSALVKKDYLALKVLSYTQVGKALTNLFQLNAAPTLLILNINEVVFFKQSGLISAKDLLQNVKASTQQIKNYPTWQRGAAKGDLEKQDWISFLLIEQLNGRINPSSPIVRDVSSLLDSSDFSSDDVQKFVSTLGIDIDNAILQTLKKRPDFIANSAYFSWPAYFKTVFNYNVARAISAQDSIFLEDVLYQLQQFPNDSNIANIELKGRQLYLAELAKWTAYDTITLNYLRGFDADSANMYQREAIFLMENYIENRPLELALKYLRLGLKQKETFELYYTLGLYFFNVGDLANAYKSAVMAYEMAKGPEESKLAARLRDLIASYY